MPANGLLQPGYFDMLKIPKATAKVQKPDAIRALRAELAKTKDMVETMEQSTKASLANAVAQLSAKFAPTAEKLWCFALL